MRNAGSRIIKKALMWFLKGLKVKALSLSSFATARDVKALANSVGWMVKFAMSYQERAPLMFFPNIKRPISDKIAAR